MGNGHAMFLLLLAKWEGELRVSSLHQRNNFQGMIQSSGSSFHQLPNVLKEGQVRTTVDGLEILHHTLRCFEIW